MFQQILDVFQIDIYDKDCRKIDSERLIVFGCIVANLCEGFLIRIQEEPSGVKEVSSTKAALVNDQKC